MNIFLNQNNRYSLISNKNYSIHFILSRYPRKIAHFGAKKTNEVKFKEFI